MHTDEDSQTTLSKWPFILGDILLVSTALAIAILGDWQLTNWQVASCVISVALGCSLFVLPYIVEHQVRVREDREDRGAEVRILHKHVVSAREEVEAAVERTEAVEVALRNVGQSAPDLSASIESLEKKIDKKLEPVGGQHLQLSEQLGAVSKRVDELSAKLKEKLDVDSLKTVEAELALLKKELAELPSKLPPPPTPKKVSEPKAPVQENAEAEEPSRKSIDRSSRSPRERREPEARLLKRAIDQKQDKSSAAVSRIIESKQKDEAPEPAEKKPALEPEKKPELEPKEDKKPEPKPEPKTGVKAEPKAEEKVAPKSDKKPEPKIEAPKPEPERKDEPKAEKKEEPKVEKKEEPKAEKKDEPKVEKKPEQKPKEVPKVAEITKEAVPQKEVAKPAVEIKATKPEPKNEEATVPPEEDMFGESVPAQVKKRVRTKKSDTAVIASVFIGIGNKPFVRGSGAGLSWDSGVEMEFEEIGRWRWIAPADLDAPIEIQLYRNDVDPDSTGKYSLEPGQQLDLSPVF